MSFFRATHMEGRQSTSILEAVHAAQVAGLPRLRFDPHTLTHLSDQHTVPALATKRISTPNLTMRSESLRNEYYAAHPKFVEKLAEVFPGSLPEMDFIAKATKLLGQYGFHRGNAMPMVGLCRDELTRSFLEDVEELWGPVFNTGSIAGMIFCGTTGLEAGMAHAPHNADGVDRFVFLAAPHVAISADGEVGKCYRAGRPAVSSACGALNAMWKELQSGELRVSLDTHDVEQCLLKQQLSGLLKFGQVPPLEDLTKLAQKLIKNQVETTIDELKLSSVEFAVISGVQVHGPDNANFFWPCDFYIHRRDGTKEPGDLKALEQVDATDLLRNAFSNDYHRVMALVRTGDMALVQKWVNPQSAHGI